MSSNTILLILACSATAHLMVSATTGIYARHKVQYLCLAWVNGIFGFLLAFVAFLSHQIAEGEPGIMHPAMIMPLLCGVYLQSIFPLSIPMPGFLQVKRMIKYARPVIALIAVYTVARLLGSKIVIMNSFSEVIQNLLSSDVLLRILALGISIYYIVNIFLLPRRLVHKTDIPSYLIGYCVCLGFSVVFFTIVSILYNPTALMIYIIIFTLLNTYLAFRTLEEIAIHLPQPVLKSLQRTLWRKQKRRILTKPTCYVLSVLNSGCKTTRKNGPITPLAETSSARLLATTVTLFFNVYEARDIIMYTSTSTVTA